MTNYLITFQNPSAPRERYIFAAESSFGALMSLFGRPEIGVDTYVAVRPAAESEVVGYPSAAAWGEYPKLLK